MAHALPTDLNMSQGMGVLMDYTNAVSGGWFANMILIAFWVIVTFGIYQTNKDFPAAIAIAGYVTFIIGTIMRVLAFISTPTYLIVIGVMIIGILAVFFAKREQDF